MTILPAGGVLRPIGTERWTRNDRFFLREDVTSVGRNPDCDIVIGFAAISRHHASFTWQDGSLVVVPHSKTNATLVNGTVVANAALLKDGDAVEFTDSRFGVRVVLNMPLDTAPTEPTPEINRRLLTMVAGDVEGYTRMTEIDDEMTMRRVNRCRDLFREISARHRGRVVDAVGDAIMIEFEAVSSALMAAVECQAEIARAFSVSDGDAQVRFRIGIDVGEVITRPDGTVYGNAVNTSARAQSEAAPGGVMVTEAAKNLAVRVPAGYHFDDAGVRMLKNRSGEYRLFMVVRD